MYTPVNPSFTIWKWGLRGSKLYRHVFVMYWCLRISLVWSVFVVYSMGNWGPKTSSWGQQRFWLACVDAQTDRSPLWVQSWRTYCAPDPITNYWRSWRRAHRFPVLEFHWRQQTDNFMHNMWSSFSFSEGIRKDNMPLVSNWEVSLWIIQAIRLFLEL